jgi:hypothetical protein
MTNPRKRGRRGGKVTHGMRHTPTYSTWASMISRTRPGTALNRKKSYRSVRVCKRWLKFENFLKDMGPRPPGMTLDRIKNSAGYCKRNCRWATHYQQMQNTTRNRIVVYKDERKCMAEWARELGITSTSLAYRLKRYSLDEALSRRKKNVFSEIKYLGEVHSLKEWASLLGISYNTLQYRLANLGLSVEDAFSAPSRKAKFGT